MRKNNKKCCFEASKVEKFWLMTALKTRQKKKLRLNIHYFKNNKNIGYERSLDKGFKIVLKKNYDLLITMDADGQHN